MNARWDRTHDRVAVSSVAELGAIATGLVRGAEVIGYLTREAEGTIAAVDCVRLTPRNSTISTLGMAGDSISPAQQAEDDELLAGIRPPHQVMRAGLHGGS